MLFVILVILIFTRPFISSLAFVNANIIHSSLLFGCLSCWLVDNKNILAEQIQTIKYPLLLLFTATVISIIFSVNKTTSIWESYKYICGMLMFMFAVCLKEKQIFQVIKVLILSGLIISLLGIYQYFFGFGHILDYLSRNNISNEFAVTCIQQQRIFFPFVTPNILGGYLILIIPLAIGTMNKQKKLTGIVLLLLLSSALILSKSLGALLSIFISMIIYSYIQSKFNSKRLVFLLGILIAIGSIFILRQTVTKQHMLPTFSFVMRLNYWQDALKIIAAYPLQGLGIGNFNLIDSRYAHNSYLQLWAEMGILGIISFLWIIITAFKQAAKRIKTCSNKKLFNGLTAASTAFLIHNLVDFTFFLPEVAFVWWIVLGFLKQKDSLS